MEQTIVDCATGAITVSALSDAQTLDLAQTQAQAQAQAAQRAADLAFRQAQQAALAAVHDALHGPLAAADAAALAGLVHKLVADPPQPLSAPELSTLARFVLRCLLP